MESFLSMFSEAEVYRLLVEALVIPYLLSGEQFGLIRVVEWIKLVSGWKDKTILGFPVMRIVAAVAAILAAAAVMFADSALAGSLASPQLFVATVASFLGFSQVWYKKIQPATEAATEPI